ncbi:MAG TPA: nucleotide exchange factor GrpE [Methanothrix sp.]|nr:nucleotide exchange factor GrpE [Methanothrix sp.]HOK57726.1 nucleotide exchange factor GrpE [Methanothrix sp.]HOL43129.1 nucleotide exchange factor GrpE [Methanothrix sp.]HPO88131.1 nucleotide exchange factor GrpE [Methanothrix sp.]
MADEPSEEIIEGSEERETAPEAAPAGGTSEDISVDEIAKLRQELEDAKRLADERLEQLLRCRAELDNVIKRNSREREELARFASEMIIKKLLVFLDSLEQAAKHDDGSRALYDQLLDIMRSEGLEPIDALGKKFDPFMHEAMMQVESQEAEDGTVVQEFQKGYTLHSKVIRTSKVAVAKRG